MKIDKKTVLFGAGAMGSALVKGWTGSKLIPPARLSAVDVDPVKCKDLSKRFKIKAGAEPAPHLKGAGLIILAVKPQQMKALLENAGPLFPRKALVVSIAAGVTCSQLEKMLPQGCPVVRVMPNTPALLGAGMAAVAGGSRSKKGHVRLALELFSSVGRAVEVAEDKMDLVTGLSGSGPAYVFRLVEGMVAAGVKGGLAPETALLLAAQTVYGAGRMVLETGRGPGELRAQVTSPGGTTQAGLKVMEDRDFMGVVEGAIEAATLRGAELRKLSEEK